MPEMEDLRGPTQQKRISESQRGAAAEENETFYLDEAGKPL